MAGKPIMTPRGSARDAPLGLVLTAARVSGDDFDFDVDSFEEESDPLQASIDELNPPQAEAASHVDGPLVVFAGAGSGKTRVITYRIANLLAVHRVPPYRVLAVTFTNKAAGEMRHRLESLVGPELARDLWVGTFHATCARLLGGTTRPPGSARASSSTTTPISAP
jgi:superfamily I DNA and RNA helicase